MILTVITPREGFKLVVRNTSQRQEEYFVDAVEVVSFGNATFFRSLERPKPFLVPVSQYEVLEAKETRTVLKNVEMEKSIKIGGGQRKEEDKKKKAKKRKLPLEDKKKEFKSKGGDTDDETKKVSSSGGGKRVIPPPDTLIKEKLKRIKDEEFFEKNILPGEVEEKPEE
jgi:hypothetical protein